MTTQGKIKYEFLTKMWKHDSPGSWYFTDLPKDISKEIRENLGWQEEGWGRMKAIAQIGNTKWESAIWFDTKMDTYILPIKSDIRKKTKLKINEDVNVFIWI